MTTQMYGVLPQAIQDADEWQTYQTTDYNPNTRERVVSLRCKQTQKGGFAGNQVCGGFIMALSDRKGKRYNYEGLGADIAAQTLNHMIVSHGYKANP